MAFSRVFWHNLGRNTTTRKLIMPVSTVKSYLIRVVIDALDNFKARQDESELEFTYEDVELKAR